MKIYNRFTNYLIYEDDSLTMKETVENAEKKKIVFRRADLRGANLRGINLEGVSLYGADLSNADLQDANLEGANLKYADLDGANLQGTDLKEAYIEEAYSFYNIFDNYVLIKKEEYEQLKGVKDVVRN